jgi:propanol-preferring alcohol dehydrogenase
MQALLLERQGPVESGPLIVMDLEAPEPGPGEVRIRVSACAIFLTPSLTYKPK